jgi:NAD(P)-dependent dehydrogenase (short-subunit alcohol dehydrogenase family)
VLVKRLSADGWKVAIHHHRSSADARSLAEELRSEGAEALSVQANLEASTFRNFFDQSNAAFGYCSILINNASIFEYDDIASISAKSIDHAYAINLRAPILLSQEFSRQLPKGSKGLIINMLDQKVFNLNPDFLSYTVMKSALLSVTELLAVALAPNIRVCAVAPGLSLRSGNQTEEGFSDSHTKTPLGFGSKPEDVAEAVSFLCRVPAMTGSVITVDAGQKLVRRSRDVMFSYGIGTDAPVSSVADNE